MKYYLARYISPAIFIVILISLFFCTPQACLEETQSLVKASFYKTGSSKIQAPDSITLYGLGRDTSKIYNKALKVQIVQIPLNPATDTVWFVLKINGKPDTLTLVYSSYPHMLSKECGFTFYHYLDTIFDTRDDLDFTFINRNITIINEENIRIFY